jgi:hypothetical protein
MSAAVIQGQWQSTGITPRFGFLLALALVLHLALIIGWNIKPQLDYSAAEPLRVRLLPIPVSRTPIAIPVQEPAPRIIEPVLQDRVAKPTVSPTTLPPKPLAPTSKPQPNAAELLRSLQKYRLSDHRHDAVITLGPQIRILGEPPPGDVMLALQDRMPDLPFGSSGLKLAFYSNGFRGDLERFGDAITQEFGFKTRYGTQVKCVLMVVLLVCGWD